jgi:hypothetical protein
VRATPIDPPPGVRHLLAQSYPSRRPLPPREGRTGGGRACPGGRDSLNPALSQWERGRGVSPGTTVQDLRGLSPLPYHETRPPQVRVPGLFAPPAGQNSLDSQPSDRVYDPAPPAIEASGCWGLYEAFHLPQWVDEGVCQQRPRVEIRIIEKRQSRQKGGGLPSHHNRS